MGARKLATSVYVTDPDSHQTVHLEAGSSPEARLADLVTNPTAWEGDTTESATPEPDGDDTADTKTAAKKTAARKPARGRSAADEGTSGD